MIGFIPMPDYLLVDSENRVMDKFDAKLMYTQIVSLLNAAKLVDARETTKLVAYLELCRQMGLTPQNEDEFNIKQVTDDFYGSLFSKSGFRHVQPDCMELYLPKDQEKYTVTYVDEGKNTDSLYAMEQLQRKDKYAVFLNGNHGLIQIKTALPNGEKLLVVKDSYANSLIPFLLKHFSENKCVRPSVLPRYAYNSRRD
ncbi:hypothetical protein PAECIP111894_03506 [Paenibacillus pseudetheri]|uniref:Uncharacterized protein n=1 Tax=Paenibacillus pseudetheri TaxID=2897682 RepID=A0ABM9BEG9_9BACL|nr:hypothetical protein PAECIP111894_03506 [Paenibacillus pseudetheri]